MVNMGDNGNHYPPYWSYTLTRLMKRKPRIRKSFKFKTLEDVETYVNRLLGITWFYQGNKLKLTELGYTFKWDKLSRKRLGYCDYTNKEIGLAKKIIELNLGKNKHIRLVVLHEIAHAICYAFFRELGHSSNWKDILLFIGGDGKVQYNPNEITMPLTKYSLICRSCDAKIPYTRKPKRVISCGYCSEVFDLDYKLSVIKNY